YQRFLAALPDIRALAHCPEEQLLKLWEGLGYYSRVRNMKRAAELLTADADAKDRSEAELPSDECALLELPGIGSYTAAAIRSIAFRQAAVAVDGNVLRVMARVRGDDRDIAQEATKRALRQELEQALSQAALPAERYGLWNQALMDLGATVCLPNGSPQCGRCPWASDCVAHGLQREQDYPVRSPKKPRKKQALTVLILRDHQGRVLVRRRPEEGLLSGLYELPNLPGHLEAAALREILAEYGLTSCSLRRLPDAKHIFTHIEWQMIGYEVLPEGASCMDGARMQGFYADAQMLQEELALASAFRVYRQLAMASMASAGR
ncbi:MAG: A/G-specific adenine glycosylase, partial [Butyrivibrio sp.]|nr:A/G-specific adenine glycosylase [Butyrivibrio sp.]